MTIGIYTLANDVVYDHLVALLNSIEVNAGEKIPVCVIPYDDRLDKVRAEVAARDNVTLLDNPASIAYWEDFATQAWKSHRKAQKVWQEKAWPVVYALGMHRKFCCFDGPFEKFIYFDADTLLMGPLDSFYQKLDNYDWVANDFQYKSDVNYVFDCSNENIGKIFNSEQIHSQIFCAGWFASKKRVFDSFKENLLEKLKAGEAEAMSLRGTDQPLFNYMVLRSGIPFYNFAYDDLANTTGNHWSSKFDVVDNVLYDKGRRLTYLHYMSISSSKFTQLCAGVDVDIPYKDVFLHYRYLKSPESRPKSFTSPSPLMRLQKSTSSFISQKAKNMMFKYRNFKEKITD